MSDPTQRFSNRVENYVKYRPGYPPEIISYLTEEAGLTPAAVVADIGSGTGILSEMFLQHGNRVYGVEPNPEMRAAAERLLSDYAQFNSVAAPAEATTLPDASIDFIVAGQAFHWFEQDKAKLEFQRILKPGGVVVLVWNSRLRAGTPFLDAYEALLKVYALDYRQVKESNITAEGIAAFFTPQACTSADFDNAQAFDFEGLRGRALSSSYAPLPRHANYGAFVQSLQAAFTQHQVEGQIEFKYETRLYWGELR
ncbi:MAG: methyltransferase domain-containing protein [Anaerolineales bacterium]|nr:methyltransferase domain-containing protein [Anaerolineales bacterium]